MRKSIRRKDSRFGRECSYFRFSFALFPGLVLDSPFTQDKRLTSLQHVNFKETHNVADDRSKAIEAALSQLEKQFGKGSVMRLGAKDTIGPISVTSTGSISFDAALGVGGVPRGRVIEIFG